VNVGVLSAAFAWIIGTYAAGLTPNDVMAGFPTSLFLTLAGVTLLFGIAEVNGTLERLANGTVRLAGGSAKLVPILFFFVACGIASVGPGSISTVALVVPLAMAVGTRAGVPRLLTALMVANGANAGNLSPISAVGVIANSRMAQAGIVGHEFVVWFGNFAAHLLAAGVSYAIVASWWKHPSPRDGVGTADVPIDRPAITATDPATATHWFTGVVIAVWVIAVVAFSLNVGLSAFGAAALLVVARAGDESKAIARMPWGVIVMVCGVTMLIGVLEKTNGMDLFAGLLSMLSTPGTINGTMAFITGLISSWSSTSGVVLPAFLPTVNALVQRVGGGDPLAVALSINVGASMVDVSPLSTLGALCVAAVTDQVAARALYNQLLIWGLSMTLVAAALCQIFAPILARW
jgi:di/tricarboxylate transporter